MNVPHGDSLDRGTAGFKWPLSLAMICVNPSNALGRSLYFRGTVQFFNLFGLKAFSYCNITEPISWKKLKIRKAHCLFL